MACNTKRTYIEHYIFIDHKLTKNKSDPFVGFPFGDQRFFFFYSDTAGTRFQHVGEEKLKKRKERENVRFLTTWLDSSALVVLAELAISLSQDPEEAWLRICKRERGEANGDSHGCLTGSGVKKKKQRIWVRVSERE